MTPKEMIYKRKSCRSFLKEPLDPQTIQAVMSLRLKPLYPDIRVHWEIVSRAQVSSICPWATPQLIAVYSQEAPGYQENIGFLFQQMDLQLQAMGLGVCWLGLGKLNAKAPQREGMKFVILLAFGRPKDLHLREDLQQFRRKSPEQIADRADTKLEPARLAPSAVNRQPWYFVHDEDVIHAYCTNRGNRLDIGIALAHLYTEYEDTFQYFIADTPPTVAGHSYIGSVKF